MSKQFVVSIKIISFLVGIGYFVFQILPLIGNTFFVIGLGGVSNVFSKFHITIYAAVFISILIFYFLLKIFRSVDQKNIIYLSLLLFIIICAFHICVGIFSGIETRAFEENKLKTLEENSIFIKEHCTEISGKNKQETGPIYRCDDGSIR